MTDYSRVNDFSAKDSLSTGNPSKLIKGSEVDDDFDAIVTAVGSKANKAVPSSAGNVATLTATGDLQDGGVGGFPSGTKMVFYQTAAPTGWTRVTTASLNDHALRVVTSSSWSDGTHGATAFTSVFGSSISTQGHALTVSELPAHTHSYNYPNGLIQERGGGVNRNVQPAAATSGSTGGNAAHDHDLTMNIKYLDLIIASKD